MASKDMVAIEVQTPQGNSFYIQLDARSTVADLKVAVAKQLHGKARLASSSRILRESDSIAELQNHGPVLAMLMPTPVQRPQQAQTQEDADDDLSLRLPANAPQWKQSLVRLWRRAHLPDALLAVLLSIQSRTWLTLVLILGLAPVANHYGFGPIYILVVIIALVFCNLGTRTQGEASAYSIFNNFKKLPGQLTADEIDRQVRHGQA